MRGGTGSESFYRENVHTDRARQGLAGLTDATRKDKHVLELYREHTGLGALISHSTQHTLNNLIYSYIGRDLHQI